MASLSQSRDRLEDRESENDEMPRRMQEAMDTRAGEARVAEAKRKGGQRGSRKKTGRMGNKEEKREENSRSKESSRGMGDLGQRGRGSKVGRGSKKDGAGKVLPMDKSLWKETI